VKLVVLVQWGNGTLINSKPFVLVSIAAFVCRVAPARRPLRFLKNSFWSQINYWNQKSGSLDNRTDNRFNLDMVRNAAWDNGRLLLPVDPKRLSTILNPSSTVSGILF